MATNANTGWLPQFPSYPIDVARGLIQGLPVLGGFLNRTIPGGGVTITGPGPVTQAVFPQFFPPSQQNNQQNPQTGSAATPTQAPVANAHGDFLLLLGEIVGVIILSQVAGINDDVGRVIMVAMAVLWLIWLMNNAGTWTQWGHKFGI